MTIMTIPMPKASRPGVRESKYDDALKALVAGGQDCYVEQDVVKAKTVANRLNGAIAGYRARTGDKSAFAVRTIQIEGKDAVCVWKLDREFTPKKSKAE